MTDSPFPGIAEVMGSNPIWAWIFFMSYFNYSFGGVHSCEDRLYVIPYWLQFCIWLVERMTREISRPITGWNNKSNPELFTTLTFSGRDASFSCLTDAIQSYLLRTWLISRWANGHGRQLFAAIIFVVSVVRHILEILHMRSEGKRKYIWSWIKGKSF